MAVDRRIDEIAARQHGVVTRSQLLTAGLGVQAVRSRVEAGRYRRLHLGVYLVGPLLPPRAPEMAAVLACGLGAVASHSSASRLRGLRDGVAYLEGAIHVTIPRCADRGRRPGIRVHRVRSLPPGDIDTVDGVPATSLARTLLDEAEECTASEFSRLLTRAEAACPGILDSLRRRLPEVAGRPGAPLLREALAGEAPVLLTRSEAESRLLALVRRGQLPDPQANTSLDGVEVDFLWRRQRVVVEVDGFAFHGSRSSFERDRRRDAALLAAGFRVLRLSWRQITAEPEATLVRLAQALAHSPAG